MILGTICLFAVLASPSFAAPYFGIENWV